jgi:DNA-binding SARP family transcriptional activator/tetratricopeptide (TPR) repeat protein
MFGVTAMARTVDLRVLGPLEVRAGGSAVPLGPRKQQIVLAMLAVHAGRVVSLDELVDEVWPDAPPVSAVANVRSYAASIRRQFEAAEDRRGRVVRQGSGYQLNAEPDELDLLAFSSYVVKGREALRSGDLATGVAVLRDAVTYWRGPMLTGLPLGPALAGRAAVVEDERLAITEELAEAQLALDEPEEAVRVLHRHVHLHPLRERAYGLLMKALCRLGDVAGALSAYAEARNALIERLGIEPGAELRRLHRAILDGSLDADESRTVVTSHRPPVVKPAELPADLVDFVGREAEIQQVLALLSGSGEATAVPTCGIVGQAGVGKTCLAVHVAHRLRATYPDGQLFVDLRGADSHPLVSTEVLARFLRALGVPGEAVPHDAQERAALYRSLLADQRLLVVLDNAADEEQVRPLLPGAPSCAVLVTSRYRLAGLVGLASVDLGVFGTDGALALLHRTAGATRVRAEPAAAEELIRLCGGLPLALRVVGVKLATFPHRALSTLVDRMAEERDRLNHLMHAGLAVRSSLDFSYHRLDPADQRLLRRVSLLDAPDFAAWTAAAVADKTVPAVEEGLDRLIAAHLVQIAGTDVLGQVRYRMHDLIRVYARDRAAAEDPEADRVAAIRHAVHHWLGLATAGERAVYGHSYYAQLGDEIGRQTLDPAALDRVSMNPLTWIEAERVTLVSAVRQAAGVGLLAECWRLACVSLDMLGYREFKDEEEDVVTVAMDAARRLGDQRGEAIALAALGKIESERGHWARSRPMLEQAERMLIAEGDKLGVALCHRELALQDRHEGQLGSAKDRYTAMIEIGRDVDLALVAQGLRGLGQVHLLAGDASAALPALESALEVSRRCAGEMPRLLVLVWYGEACLQLGDTTRAAASFREVASWSERVGATSGEVWSLCGLAHVALTETDIGEAERLASRAHSLCQLFREPSSWMVASLTLARVRLAQGRLTSAKELAEEALDDSRSLGAVVEQARTLDLMAEIHEAAGDHEAAAAARAEAATLQPAVQPA